MQFVVSSLGRNMTDFPDEDPLFKSKFTHVIHIYTMSYFDHFQP